MNFLFSLASNTPILSALVGAPPPTAAAAAASAPPGAPTSKAMIKQEQPAPVDVRRVVRTTTESSDVSSSSSSSSSGKLEQQRNDDADKMFRSKASAQQRKVKRQYQRRCSGGSGGEKKGDEEEGERKRVPRTAKPSAANTASSSSSSSADGEDAASAAARKVNVANQQPRRLQQQHNGATSASNNSQVNDVDDDEGSSSSSNGAATTSSSTSSHLPSIPVMKTSPEASEMRCKSYDDMPLLENVLRGIYAYGFENPSHIQQLGIPVIIAGGDCVLQSNSGTGKTGAFVPGLLQRCFGSTRDSSNSSNTNRSLPHGLVLCPSRELAEQTVGVVDNVGEYVFREFTGGPRGGGSRKTNNNSILAHAFVGGTRVQDDIRACQAGVAVVVGNPGRVLDLMKRGALVAEEMTILVVDEADEMLSHNMVDQLYELFCFLPRGIQVVLVGTTFPQQTIEMTKKFMRSPLFVSCSSSGSYDDASPSSGSPAPFLLAPTVKHFFVDVEKEEYKLSTLADLYESISISQSMVFFNTRRKIDWVTEQMNLKNCVVSCLHADMCKGDRDAVVRQFRRGNSRVLCTGDLICRGIDVHHLNIVVNYDTPNSVESYVHRTGRAGRYGRKGVAVTFVTQNDVSLLKGIEKSLGVVIEELPLDFAKYLK